MTTCSVFACESQPIVLEGLERVLERSGEFLLVGSASSPIDALEQVATLRPRVILLDQTPGWRSIFRFTAELKKISEETLPVLWISELPDSNSYRALQAGVRGVFHKTLPVAALLECLKVVSCGETWMAGSHEPPWTANRDRVLKPRLTPREREIVQLVARGLKNREIAEQLSITAGTVKVHLMHVFEKTGVGDRYQLSVRAPFLLGRDPDQDGDMTKTLPATRSLPGLINQGN